MKTLVGLVICFAVMVQVGAYCQSVPMVEIKGGEFMPLYGANSAVKIDDFSMDVYPVTNEQFAEFVKKFPRWKKSEVKRLFADANYLSQWKSDEDFGTLPANSPVTNVSWYAAKNYCECQGKRLPTVDEWEYVAMANQKMADAREEANYNQYILKWYETPNTYNNEIGKTFKNYWGVYDMHGLVWEWTLDFNSVMVSGESRKGSTGDNNLFCGAAALGASDLMNYAAFMRYAFRGSMKANYNVKNLGFRCVKDVAPEIL
ncbi:MAG TPA: formylglycine-generating enzyme family protein [Salinimicrobium sp.]|nr:formylglycine-generating enzyme family protein [Salinimicrobium sp.]